MITVITNEGYQQPVENPYDGLSLAEACEQMRIDINEAVTEFMQNTLVTEHAYLLENGFEIKYFNEEGETAAGKSIKEKAIELVKKIGNFLKGVWDKIYNWFTDKINAAKEAFFKLSLTKADYKKAVAFIKEKEFDFTISPLVIKAGPIRTICKHDFGYINDPLSEKGPFYKEAGAFIKERIPEFAEKSVEAKSLDRIDVIKYITDAEEYIFGGNSVFKDIKAGKKVAEDNVKAAEKRLSAIKNEEELQLSMEYIKDAMNSNAIVCKDKIKVFTAVINANFALAKNVMMRYHQHNKNVRQEEFNQKKEAVVQGLNKGKDKVQNAYGKTVDSINNGINKVSGGIKSVTGNLGKKKTEKVEGEVVESASMYDGKYFRV